MSSTEALSRTAPRSWLPRRRLGNLLGFLACAGLLGFGYYLQFVVGLEPCPLCILQRLVLLAIGVTFLVAAIHHPRRRWSAQVYGGVVLVFSVLGLGIAGRHVWLQHTPESMRPACGPGLEYLFNTFGPIGSLGRILRGSGECGNVDWTLLGLSIPEWTLGAFFVFAIYGLLVSFRD